MFGHLKGEPRTEKDVIPGRGRVYAKNTCMPNTFKIRGQVTHSKAVTKHVR